MLEFPAGTNPPEGPEPEEFDDDWFGAPEPPPLDPPEVDCGDSVLDDPEFTATSAMGNFKVILSEILLLEIPNSV